MTIDTTVAEAFLLALARASAWVMSMPLLGSRGVSAAGRLAVALGLAIFLAVPVSRQAEMPTTALGLAGAVILQVGIGLLLGWLVSLAVSAFRISGVLIDYMSGFGSGALFDPVSGNLSAVFARFAEAAFTLLLFVTPAWHGLVRGFLTSFEAIPVGETPQVDDGLVGTVSSTVGTMLTAAVQIGAPVLGALFITEAALALAARFVPQANVFIVGLPLKALVAFSTMGALLVFYPHYVERLVELGVDLGEQVGGR
jgi:flagellar biosynthetic protein FliR